MLDVDILVGVSTPPSTLNAPLYHEEQRFRQWWVWVLVFAPAALAWWPFMQQIIGGKPVGQNPAPDWVVWVLWLLIGLALPLLFGRIRLTVEVTAEQVLIRYRPFSHREVALADIQEVQARQYNAVKEYGGWGVKGWSKDKMAYNVSGDWGAELTLKDGRRIMLGSQRAEELAAAIEAGRRGAAATRPKG
jgi:hypothetical protein